MKYTIHGFSQQKAIEFGLDERDLMILRWFIDYKDTGKMAKKVIASWKKDTVYRRLRGMADKGVLKHKTLKQGGIWSYYTIGPNYIYLTDTNGEIAVEVGNKSEGIGNKSEGIGKKSEGIGKKSEGIGKKSGTKNSSIINSSIINTSNNNYRNLLLLYEQLGFGLVNPVTAKDIEILSTEYSFKWVEEAMKEANDYGIRNMKYVKGILKNWNSNGRKEDKDGRKDRGTGDSRDDLGQQLRDEGIGFSTDDL